MNITDEERRYEEEHLASTLKSIEEIISQKNIDIEDYKKSIVTRKRFLYEHANEFFGADLRAHMNEEDLNVDLLNNDIKKVYKLYRSLETPYFSRIDFETQEGKETFYIGLTGIDKDYEPLVYDWRAPIANLYYNYGLGPSSYEGIEGRIEGTTSLKRQFDIKMGVLKNIYDNELGLSDELLVMTLANNTSEHMRAIVDTIQKEQNEIIRYSGTSTLVVEGVAGSGKTSVALHRIAYLLYNQKDLNDKNVLIFSPGDTFTNYISNVLPELGEENVSTTTFKEFAQNYIKGHKIESLTEFIERYYEEGDPAFDKTKFKLDYEYKSTLDRKIRDYFDSLIFTKKIGLKKKFLTKDELNAIKSSVPSNLTFSDKISFMSDRICSKFAIDEIKNSPKMAEMLYKILNIETDPVELYNSLTEANLDDKIHYEDLFGILYVYFEIHGYPTLNYIKQVIIDEAQDYSMWQFELIKNIFKSASFTILGDSNQSINPYLHYEKLDSITKLFKDAKYRRLDRTYRSSKEIIEFAGRILNLSSISSIRPSYGLEVESLTTDKTFDEINRILDDYEKHGFDRVAIITKTSRESEHFKERFRDRKVDILPVYMAKGLEYDGVIVATESDPFDKSEKTLFYVAVTRALHALAVINEKINLQNDE